ncbi:MAG: DUF1700 domain-containing protein [Lachnospiraceae bacterium]|nr:DUF1700 domain-containing protein [Lachnospiraceae bacterium]
MEDFLSVLKLQLMDRLEPKELDEQLALYENYINEQLEEGQTMEQVLARLGDPAKVADMIVEHEEGIVKRHEVLERPEKETPLLQRDMTEEEVNAQIKNPPPGMGVHAEFTEDEGWDVRVGKFKLNGWYGTLIIVGVVLVIFIVISQLMNR